MVVPKHFLGALSAIVVSAMALGGSWAAPLAHAQPVPVQLQGDLIAPCPDQLASYEGLTRCEIHVIPPTVLQSWLATAQTDQPLPFVFEGSKWMMQLYSSAAGAVFNPTVMSLAPGVFPFQGNVSLPAESSWIPGAGAAITFDMNSNQMSGAVRLSQDKTFIIQPLAPLPPAVTALLPNAILDLLAQGQPELAFEDGTQMAQGSAEGNSTMGGMAPMAPAAPMAAPPSAPSTMVAGCFAPSCWQDYSAFVHVYYDNKADVGNIIANWNTFYLYENGSPFTLAPRMVALDYLDTTGWGNTSDNCSGTADSLLGHVRTIPLQNSPWKEDRVVLVTDNPGSVAYTTNGAWGCADYPGQGQGLWVDIRPAVSGPYWADFPAKLMHEMGHSFNACHDWEENAGQCIGHPPMNGAPAPNHYEWYSKTAGTCKNSDGSVHSRPDPSGGTGTVTLTMYAMATGLFADCSETYVHLYGPASGAQASASLQGLPHRIMNAGGSGADSRHIYLQHWLVIWPTAVTTGCAASALDPCQIYVGRWWFYQASSGSFHMTNRFVDVKTCAFVSGGGPNGCSSASSTTRRPFGNLGAQDLPVGSIKHDGADYVAGASSPWDPYVLPAGSGNQEWSIWPGYCVAQGPTCDDGTPYWGQITLAVH